MKERIMNFAVGSDENNAPALVLLLEAHTSWLQLPLPKLRRFIAILVQYEQQLSTLPSPPSPQDKGPASDG